MPLSLKTEIQQLTGMCSDSFIPTPFDRPVQALVSLVGAGPGDPELLTIRALKRLQQAQVLLYDFLVSPNIVDLAPASCERICVGKRASNHTLTQAEINQLLLDKARQGLRVVRLKGGDPFMFGRGGEELQELARAGIACEIVPGITAALGAAASSGIPLTHRDHAQMVSFVTGHRKQDSSNLDWVQHLSPHSTLVIYMGLGQAPRIARELIAYGHLPATPVAAIAHATTAQQQVLISTLANIEADLQAAKLQSPALLIVGSVVQLHSALYPLIQQAAKQIATQAG